METRPVRQKRHRIVHAVMGVKRGVAHAVGSLGEGAGIPWTSPSRRTWSQRWIRSGSQVTRIRVQGLLVAKRNGANCSTDVLSRPSRHSSSTSRRGRPTMARARTRRTRWVLVSGLPPATRGGVDAGGPLQDRRQKTHRFQCVPNLGRSDGRPPQRDVLQDRPADDLCATDQRDILPQGLQRPVSEIHPVHQQLPLVDGAKREHQVEKGAGSIAGGADDRHPGPCWEPEGEVRGTAVGHPGSRTRGGVLPPLQGVPASPVRSDGVARPAGPPVGPACPRTRGRHTMLPVVCSAWRSSRGWRSGSAGWRPAGRGSVPHGGPGTFQGSTSLRWRRPGG